mmetsp:Transcript_5345/g.13731  ORF Transcript_5345/g.13731 Transcript_5345/m.13731 type:complete len:397 (-) Transcript_5345:287-1477(-)
MCMVRKQASREGWHWPGEIRMCFFNHCHVRLGCSRLRHLRGAALRTPGGGTLDGLIRHEIALKNLIRGEPNGIVWHHLERVSTHTLVEATKTFITCNGRECVGSGGVVLAGKLHATTHGVQRVARSLREDTSCGAEHKNCDRAPLLQLLLGELSVAKVPGLERVERGKVDGNEGGEAQHRRGVALVERTHAVLRKHRARGIRHATELRLRLKTDTNYIHRVRERGCGHAAQSASSEAGGDVHLVRFANKEVLELVVRAELDGRVRNDADAVSQVAAPEAEEALILHNVTSSSEDTAVFPFGPLQVRGLHENLDAVDRCDSASRDRASRPTASKASDGLLQLLLRLEISLLGLLLALLQVGDLAVQLVHEFEELIAGEVLKVLLIVELEESCALGLF